MKKSKNLDQSNFGTDSKVINGEIFTLRKHVPRSVCDTERDRRQHKDPLKEEEL